MCWDPALRPPGRTRRICTYRLAARDTLCGAECPVPQAAATPMSMSDYLTSFGRSGDANVRTGSDRPRPDISAVVSRPASALRHVHAQEESLPSSWRSNRVCSRRRLGMVNTTCRCATGRQTSSATWIAVSKVRFWWQDGHVQRCLQEKATARRSYH